MGKKRVENVFLHEWSWSIWHAPTSETSPFVELVWSLFLPLLRPQKALNMGRLMNQNASKVSQNAVKVVFLQQ